MRKQIKFRLEEYAVNNICAKTLERKAGVDNVVRIYLFKRSRSIEEYTQSYNYYKRLIK